MLSMCSTSLMTLTDRLCLSWYDLFEMNASFQAGCLFWTLVVFPTLIGNFVNTFVSQYNGAGQRDRIGSIVWQGAFIGFVWGLVLIAITPLIGPFFRMCGADEASSILEQKYWFYISLGTPASLALEPFVSFFNGIYKTKIVMVVTLIGFAINIILDPIMIFGVGGHMRWGISGAAIATSIAVFVKFAVFLYAFLREDRLGLYQIKSSFRVRLDEMKNLITRGSMSAFQGTIEHGFYALFSLLMGTFSVAASQSMAIAFNLNCLLYMPAIGVALATASLVGNQLGAGKPELSKRATYTATVIGLIFAGFCGCVFLAVPHVFVDLYSLGDPENFADVRPIAINVLRIVALYLVADSTNLIFTAALRGAGDTYFIMIATTIVVALTLVVLYAGLYFLHLRVYWCWWVMTGYLVANAGTFIVRFHSGRWKDKGVIEPKQA